MHKVVVSVVLLVFLVSIIAMNSFAQTQCVITLITGGFVEKESLEDVARLGQQGGINEAKQRTLDAFINKLSDEGKCFTLRPGEKVEMIKMETYHHTPIVKVRTLKNGVLWMLVAALKCD